MLLTVRQCCVWLHRTYLGFWNVSFASYLLAVDGSASVPTAGNQSALLASVNQLTYPNRACVLPNPNPSPNSDP